MRGEGSRSRGKFGVFWRVFGAVWEVCGAGIGQSGRERGPFPFGLFCGSGCGLGNGIRCTVYVGGDMGMGRIRGQIGVF